MKSIIKGFCIITLIISIASCEKYGGNNLSMDSMGPASYNEKYKEYGENPFLAVSDHQLSTFSIDADGGSYSNMRRYLYLGQIPPAASVRVEEYLNYFTFDYPEPGDGENVALNTELSECPWKADHQLLRIGIKGKSIPESELENSNYVFLIDVSGSMDSPDKLGVLKSGFIKMTEGLRDNDKVAIVTYAGTAGVLLESTSADNRQTIKSAIESLGAGGSTAGAAGITTAYEIAEQNFIQGGNNRVILGTDGDFNVGPSSTDEMIKLIEDKRKTGIYLTVLGVGGGNLNDHMMEQLADKGNGNYEYIDNARQIEKIFILERSKLYTVAKDCKIQLSFNSAVVDSFRLIGYENRALNNEEFDNDTTDAGELGASQTVTALYEIVLKESSAGGELANFDFRYKLPGEDQSRLLNHKIQPVLLSLSNASENMRFAASVTAFGLLMKGSKYKANASKTMLLNLATNAMSFDPNGFRKEFVDLVKSWGQ